MLRVHCAVLNARTSTLVCTCSQSYGGHGERETPGNIPNPEAKPLSADGTALETGWESRTPPDNHSPKGPQPMAGALSHSLAAPDLLRRGADVVGQPLVQRPELPPGGADLLQGLAGVQPLRRLPAAARVQRLVLQQFHPLVVGGEPRGHAAEPLAVDAESHVGQPGDLLLEAP